MLKKIGSTIKKHWKSALLVISVGLNFIIIGGTLSHHSPSSDSPRADTRGFIPVIRAMPEENRRALRDEFKKNRSNMREMKKELDGSWGQMVTIIRKKPFDKKDIEAFFQNQRKIILETTRNGHQIITIQIEKMSPEERQEFAKRLENMIKKQQERAERKKQH